MSMLRFHGLILSLIISSCLGLAACNDGKANSDRTTTLPLENNNLATNSTKILSSNQSATETTDKQIIFITESAFTGNLKAEAVLIHPNCAKANLSVFQTADCICDQYVEQIRRVGESVIYLKPTPSNPQFSYYRALLQGNNATEKGVTYYKVKHDTYWTLNTNNPKKSFWYQGATVGDSIAIATGPDLVGYGGNLQASISDSPIKVWTGITPAGNYESNAIGDIPAGIYEYFWISQEEMKAILNISGKFNVKIEPSALSKVRFSCGKFADSSYESATSWSSAESTIHIPNSKGSLDIVNSGITGLANSSANAGAISPTYSAWWYMSGTDASNVDTKGCGERRHLYCVGPYAHPRY